MLTRRRFLGHTCALTALGALSRRAIASSAGPSASPNSRAGVPVRVFAAGPPAAALVYILSPESLLGWPSKLDEAALAMLGRSAASLPVLGRLSGRGSTVSLESLVQWKPDLILDVGSVGPTHASMADRVREQTGIRYELLDGRLLSESATLLRRAGALLDAQARAARLAGAAERLVAEVVSGRARHASRRMYLARGADGLETGLRGSINVEVLEFVGAQNVAASAGTGSLTRVSLEQLVAWDPDVVVTQDASFAAGVTSRPVWQGLRAVREGRVWLAPSLPFGWLDGPPCVNRLIGALWLARRLDATPVRTIREEVRQFYDAFYRISLASADLDRLLREA